jgi:S1-C subfamily serine protease
MVDNMRCRSIFTASVLLALALLASPLRALAQDETSKRVAPAIATILARNAAGNFEVIGSGVFVRGDGVLLTAYNLLQGAREIQVRLANGEIYDKVELAASDERRNVAVLRINATSTPFVLIGILDESSVGTQVSATYNASGQITTDTVGTLNSVSMADEIPGAGTGFRVLKFTTPVTAEAAGGVLVDSYGRALGLIAPLPQAQARNYAVPLYNVVGLARSVPTSQVTTIAIALAPGLQPLNRAIPVSQPSTTPLEPMPQVSVPQRPTSPLAPAGPGSVVVREVDPAKLLLASKTLYVTSDSNLFKPVQLLNELRKRQEFADWHLSFVDEREVADLVLEIEHVPLTWEFPFSIKHQRTGIVIATGKVYVWGGDGAQLMAARVVEHLTRVRAGVKERE